MKPEQLYAFYQYAMLPQFELGNQTIIWHPSAAIGPDETAHHFSTLECDYLLVFED